jgi:hypothetical protein
MPSCSAEYANAERPLPYVHGLFSNAGSQHQSVMVPFQQHSATFSAIKSIQFSGSTPFNIKSFFIEFW